MTDLEALTKLIEELEKNQAILFQQFAKDCPQCDGTGTVTFLSGVHRLAKFALEKVNL
jgi:hypothetical protein